MKTVKQVLLVIIAVIVLAEIYYRVKGDYKTYSEQIGQPFNTDYGKVLDSWFNTWKDKEPFTPPNGDFQYQYSISKQHLRDKEYSYTKPDSVKRILISGDSFTEGVGAPYDSTWPRMLEKDLRKLDNNVEVIDAGVSGSDIFFDYVLYREQTHNFKPDVVIASMNSSDLNDYMYRGGMERFKDDGTTHYHKGPWYLVLYKYSHFARAILHKIYNFKYIGQFVTEKDVEAAMPAVEDEYVSVFKKYQAEAIKNEARFYAVLHSCPSEILYKNETNYASVKFMNDMVIKLQSAGIPVINLMPGLDDRLSKKDRSEITYMHDMHYNPFGYSVFAELAADSLVSRGILSVDTVAAN